MKICKYPKHSLSHLHFHSFGPFDWPLARERCEKLCWTVDLKYLGYNCARPMGLRQANGLYKYSMDFSGSWFLKVVGSFFNHPTGSRKKTAEKYQVYIAFYPYHLFPEPETSVEIWLVYICTKSIMYVHIHTCIGLVCLFINRERNRVDLRMTFWQNASYCYQNYIES